MKRLHHGQLLGQGRRNAAQRRLGGNLRPSGPLRDDPALIGQSLVSYSHRAPRDAKLRCKIPPRGQPRPWQELSAFDGRLYVGADLVGKGGPGRSVQIREQSTRIYLGWCLPVDRAARLVTLLHCPTLSRPMAATDYSRSLSRWKPTGATFAAFMGGAQGANQSVIGRGHVAAHGWPASAAQWPGMYWSCEWCPPRL